MRATARFNPLLSSRCATLPKMLNALLGAFVRLGHIIRPGGLPMTITLFKPNSETLTDYPNVHNVGVKAGTLTFYWKNKAGVTSKVVTSMPFLIQEVIAQPD